jgi:hypothetical protein
METEGSGSLPKTHFNILSAFRSPKWPLSVIFQPELCVNVIFIFVCYISTIIIV